MRELAHVIIFSGKDAFPLDLKEYTKVVENCIEYESSISMSIDFYKGEKIVRRIWNLVCDTRYKEEA